MKSTGGCCTDTRFSIHISELEPFKKAFEQNPSISKGHKLEKFDGDEVYLYDSKNNPCIFLNMEKRCSIYEKRPLTCRLYPILWKERSKYIDFACPISHTVPLREIMQWLEKKENKAQLKKMEALDFNERLAQYISISHVIKISECLEFIYNEV